LIPDHVRQFLASTISSAWALDLLCLLKSTASREWSVSELTAELRGSTPLVEDILNVFTRRGLVSRRDSGRYRYDCRDAETDELVVEVAGIYREAPMALIKEIVRTPHQKIHTFVDAFRLK
jgi:DNA-binding IclR family transcriptional regulator